MGRPKGSKNKKTLEKEKQLKESGNPQNNSLVLPEGQPSSDVVGFTTTATNAVTNHTEAK